MKSTETHQTSTGETVTISRAEYEEFQALRKKISELESRVDVLMEALRLARHKHLEKERYYSILKQANHVVYVNRKYKSNCMLERNRYMVDHSSFLLAVYNGKAWSGTGSTVNYARRMGREIIIIDPLARTVNREGGQT